MNINNGLFKVKFSKAIDKAIVDFKCECCLEDVMRLVADESIIKISVTKMTASQYFKGLLDEPPHCDAKMDGKDGNGSE